MVFLLHSYGLNGRRYFWITLILLFTLLAFAAGSEIFIAFVTLASLFFVILIVDFMFADEKQFNYNPDYSNWERQQTGYN
mmetsp:Transcript_13356/g.24724  ORF Transcript_13356/g.24724 Transcript_13356/m.24724 type:complete len:80 (-) Transcript_13356:58-297(-)